jgi:hypothetical protein
VMFAWFLKIYRKISVLLLGGGGGGHAEIIQCIEPVANVVFSEVLFLIPKISVSMFTVERKIDGFFHQH